MAGRLEAGVQIFLDVLPDGVAIGAQHNKALDAGILDQLGLRADVGVPLGEVDLLSGDRLDHFFLTLLVCEVLDVLIGDLNAELVGQGGDHINNVKAVCAEIVDNVAVGGNLFRLDLKLVGQIVTDAAENFGIHNLTPL